MAGKGGYRPGSGRKKGPATIEREKMKDYIAQRVAENGAALVTVLMDKALGGDIMAMRELFDRGFGKAAQSIDHTTKGEKMVIPLLDRGLSKDDSSSEDTSA